VGIVGANAERAWAHDAHIPALAKLPQFRLAAVSARTQELADQAARAFNAPRAIGDSIKLVQDKDIDVVAVTVKVPEHRAIVLAALAAGKHLFCEWPLGRDAAEAKEMADAAARAKNSHVIIGLQALCAPAVRKAVEIVAAGKLGRLLMLRVVSPTAGWAPLAPRHYTYLQQKEHGATLSTISGGHTIAAMEALAGAYTEVDARSSIIYPDIGILGSNETVKRTVPDHVLVIGKHASGCLSSLEVMGGQPGVPFRLDMIGSNGSLAITTERARGGFQTSRLEISASVPFEPVAKSVSSELSGPPANVAETYVRLADDIRAGTHTTPDFQLALRLTRLLDAIEAASDQGKRQYIKAD
jgi:predicted dehydrogenase